MPSAAVGEDGEDEAVDSRWDFDGGGGGGAHREHRISDLVHKTGSQKNLESTFLFDI